MPDVTNETSEDFGDEEQEELQEKEAFESLAPKVLDAAKAAKLDADDVTDPDFGSRYLIISLPCGRNKRSILLNDSADLSNFLSVELEGLSFLDGLEALCDYKAGTVEVGLEPVGNLSSSSLARHFFPSSQPDQDNPPELILKSDDGQHTFRIGFASQKYRVFATRPTYRRLTMTMSIEGLQGHDKIISHLKTLSNSLFFQIDLLFNQPIALSRSRDVVTIGRRAFRRRPVILSQVEYPKHEYDEAPSSLYWYGRAASAMPLLQFLAFYQVVEYFYPVYSKVEVNRRLKLVLNDPSFRPERDSDIGRLVNALSINRSGGFLDERSQLKAVMNECLTSDAIRQFIESSDEKKTFYKKDCKKIHDINIVTDAVGQDLRIVAAERLYGIRCRVVHTKEDGKDELGILLPYSKEEQSLAHDIDLMQFIARAVLVASGTKMH
ncbi:hypothetical protein HZY97_19030 [Sphingomonas sp. R-74633]|uniref:hypothetical protein n=1 Tax=Sphingomonas sp. R-74633 TaxID=2751188 RepID=UPI0015D31BF6|nr:hypothetical protein [Sphingomonas sp. R-74633]NYT42875.1 hypothetical protein [Sphingomonas sp. R-74633]